MRLSSPQRFLALAATTLPQLVSAVNSFVALDYASYNGVSGDNGISKWLGIRYAAPPLGNLRFAEPQDPNHEFVPVDASNHGPICLDTKATLPDGKSSEDCLFLDVYAPSSATTRSKLPVYVFIQGGGFQANSNYNYDGTGLIQASNNGIVVVTLNYRVGPFGFLASKEVAKGGSLNNGLKDQRKALQWVQKYISRFGGDPSHVVLGGASAGASSVTFHLTAYGGRNDNLFIGTTSESQAMGVELTVDQSQFVYDGLVSRTGCKGKSDTLACLRSLNINDLQSKNIVIPFPGQSAAGLYVYGPTLDGDLIQDYMPNLLAQGKYIRVPAIFGDDTNEGTVFTPRSLNSQSDTNAFLTNNFPDLTSDQLNKVAQLYPVNNYPTFANAGRYWRQAADIFGEMRYICPGLAFTRYWARNGVVWNYRWNVLDPATEDQGKHSPFPLLFPSPNPH
jgi:carboxylesterase type B